MSSNQAPYIMAAQKIGLDGYTFTNFSNVSQYFKYHKEIEDSHHYEVISGNQCLYFDFEGKIDVHETDFPEFVNVIKNTFPTEALRIDVYTSSGLEKISYHIIIKGVYFENHLVNKYLADKIIFALSDVNMLKELYDSTVYTSKRNLRLVGSRKLNSTRVKRFLKTLYINEKFKDLYNKFLSTKTLVDGCESFSHKSMQELNFRLSLASDIYLCKCVKIIIPGLLINEKRFDSDKPSFTLEDLENITQYLETYYHGIFDKEKTDVNFFTLKRLKPHHCTICERAHSSDNAFIFKVGENVYFGCHRDPKNYTLIEKDKIYEVKFIPRNIIKQQIEEEEIYQKIAKKLLRAFPI